MGSGPGRGEELKDPMAVATQSLKARISTKIQIKTQLLNYSVQMSSFISRVMDAENKLTATRGYGLAGDKLVDWD